MAFRLELSDLPPRYRAQAEAQLAKGRKKRSDPLAEAARAAKITGLTAWASMNITSAPWPQRWRGVRSWSGRPTHAFPCSRRDNTGL